MSDRLDKIQLTLPIIWNSGYEEQSEMLMKIIEQGNLASFLYVVLSDISNGVYDIQEGETRMQIDQLVKMAEAQANTISNLSSNLEDVMNWIRSAKVDKVSIPKEIEETLEEVEEIIPEVMDLESIEDNDNPGDSDLNIDGFADVFKL